MYVYIAAALFYSSVMLLALKWYRDVLNPVTVFMAKDFILAITIPLLYWVFDMQYYPRPENMDYVAYSLLSYALGIIFGTLFFLTLANLKVKIFSQYLGGQFVTGYRFFPHGLFSILFILVALGMLIGTTDGGWLWVTDSRSAYQYHRSGAGIQYVITHISILFATVYLGFNSPKGFFMLMVRLLPVLFLAFFLGSKSLLLHIVVIGVFSKAIGKNPLSQKDIVLVFSILLLLVFMVIPIYGEFSNFSQILSYFDHAKNFSEITHIDRTINQRIDIYLSAIFEYVPRSLYPEKPYVYGDVWLSEFLQPSIAEQGHTLGGLGFTFSALVGDFLGVFFAAFIAAFFGVYIYQKFKKTKNIFWMLIYCHIYFVPVVKHLPLLFSIVTIYVIYSIFRTNYSPNKYK